MPPHLGRGVSSSTVLHVLRLVSTEYIAPLRPPIPSPWRRLHQSSSSSGTIEAVAKVSPPHFCFTAKLIGTRPNDVLSFLSAHSLLPPLATRLQPLRCWKMSILIIPRRHHRTTIPHRRAHLDRLSPIHLLLDPILPGPNSLLTSLPRSSTISPRPQRSGRHLKMPICSLPI